jgi:hypothetical protein
VRLPWRAAAVLVCRECDGAPDLGPKKVRKALKARTKGQPKRTVRVLSVSCLDACPKRGVTVATTGPVESAVVVRTRAHCDSVVDDLVAELGRGSS